MMQRKLFLAGLTTVGLVYAGAASAQIKVGVAGPLSGANAAFGAQLRNGVSQAVEDINAAGGIIDKKLSLSIGDDAADPKQGRNVANKFGDRITWVVGHFNSSVTMPASETCNENAIIDITPGSTNPQITERGYPFMFRTCGRDDQQGGVAGKYLIDNFKGKKVAIIQDKTTYGKGLADETKKILNTSGVREVLYEGLNVGEKDYSAIVSKIKASGADLVYYGGVHTEAGLLVRQMRDQGVRAPLMGGDGIASEEFAAIAGPGAEGTLMTFPPDPRLRPEAADLVKRFEAKKFNPETYTLYSYAAVQILKQAAEQAKSTDTQAMIDIMHSGKPFKTVIGDISYDKKGDVTRADYVVYR
jgi:branched-chain amino acid transport system substrate-binding protein